MGSQQSHCGLNHPLLDHALKSLANKICLQTIVSGICFHLQVTEIASAFMYET